MTPTTSSPKEWDVLSPRCGEASAKLHFEKLRRWQGVKDGVIATGGGVVLDEDNRGVLSDDDPVVWLEASLACLQSRLEPTLDRPGLVSADVSTEEFLVATLENRRSLYAAIANHHIDTDSMSIEEVAAKIEDIWMS
jgi:shikimate kinase